MMAEHQSLARTNNSNEVRRDQLQDELNQLRVEHHESSQKLVQKIETVNNLEIDNQKMKSRIEQLKKQIELREEEEKNEKI